MDICDKRNDSLGEIVKERVLSAVADLVAIKIVDLNFFQRAMSKIASKEAVQQTVTQHSRLFVISC